MNPILIIRAVAGYTKNSKTTLAIVVACSLLWQQTTAYVDKKHKEGTDAVKALASKVEEDSREVAQVRLSAVQSTASLKAIETSMGQVVQHLRVMDDRLWELQRKARSGDQYSGVRIEQPQEEETLHD
jgi:K+ transporter